MRPEDRAGLRVELPESSAEVAEIHGAADYSGRPGDVARRRRHPLRLEGARARDVDCMLERLVAGVCGIAADCRPLRAPALRDPLRDDGQRAETRGHEQERATAPSQAAGVKAQHRALLPTAKRLIQLTRPCTTGRAR